VMLSPSPDERSALTIVLSSILEAVGESRAVLLPRPVSFETEPSVTALHRAGSDPNPYGATVGEFRYQFEGEDDLLHLFVVRQDGLELSPEEGQSVAGWVLEKVPPGLVWFKPGRFTQHFYLGHDDLVAALSD